MMLHTKYQGSRLCGFRLEDFFMFSLYKPNNLNKLGRGPLDDASYQISSSRPCGFRLKDF